MQMFQKSIYLWFVIDFPATIRNWRISRRDQSKRLPPVGDREAPTDYPRSIYSSRRV